MFKLFRKRRIERYVEHISTYVLQKYEEPKWKDDDIVYSFRNPQYDTYDEDKVTKTLRKTSKESNDSELISELEQYLNQSFVDRLIYYINKKGVRASEVYKAAQIDKRLFSKMIQNREYKPAKDTAIALVLALELPLNEARDMLSRAGYVFSHSSKRDIIIEYFFKEGIYNLVDLNDVLERLEQKVIGRF